MKRPWGTPGQGLALLLVAAAGLRFFRLDHHALWLDEAHMLYAATYPTVHDVLNFVNLYEVHPPLYYLIVHAILQFGDSPWLLRLPSCLFSIGTVAVMFALGRELEGPSLGLWAAALLTFCGYELPFAQEIRMYPTLLFFVTTAAWQFVAWLRRDDPRCLAGCVLASLVALYVDHRTLLILAGLAPYGLPVYRTRWKETVVALGVFAVAAIPAALILHHQSSSEGGGTSVSLFFHRPTVEAFLHSVSAMVLSDVLQFPAHVHDVVGIFVLLFCLLGIWHQKRNTASLGLVVFLVAEGIMIGYSLTRSQIFSVHHMIFALPFLLLALAQAMQVLWSRSQVVAVTLMGVYLLVNGCAIQQWDCNPVATRQDFRAAVAWLTPQLQPGDVVVVVPKYMKYPFYYYYRAPNAVAAVNIASLSEAMAMAEHAPRSWWVFANEAPVDPGGVIRKYVNDHYRTLAVHIVPNLPYEVTGLGIEIYLETPDSK